MSKEAEASCSTASDLVACSKCGKHYKPQGIAPHEKACKGNQVPSFDHGNLTCEYCKKSIKNKAGLTTHMNNCPLRPQTETHDCRCGLSFKSLGCLQLHRRRAHEAEYFAEQPRSKVPRWTEGEVDLLINMSAELTIAKTKFINVEIQNKTGWKLEAIKKKRQNMKEEINKRIEELMTS